MEIPKIWSELPIKSRYVELAPWLLIASAILFLLEIFERRTGWVSRFFGRKPAAAQNETEESGAEIPQAATAKKPAFPWLVRKPAQKIATVAKTKPAAPVSTAPAETKPAPEKPASMESAIDALRKARERAHKRTDKER